MADVTVIIDAINAGDPEASAQLLPFSKVTIRMKKWLLYVLPS